tara:strand:+ start:1137 stop:1874 length:738 start_codon:yes stop_codon:yes gene_type:complete
MDDMKSLTITGVGPGDPSLLTIAAVDAIKDSTVVSYPVANEGGDSLAEKIASRWITKDKTKLPLHFPMVLEQSTLKSAWSEACNQLMEMVNRGERVVFIAQGDISLFSTGSYLTMELAKNYPGCHIKLIPGVTSFAAAAAKSKLALALQDEQLLVLPVPELSLKLKNILSEAEFSRRTVVLLKIGIKWTWVKQLLKELDLLDSSIFAENVGLSHEQVVKASNLPSDFAPYFSLLIIRQSWPKTIP